MDNLNEILRQRQTYQGLASAEARARLEKYGPNQRPPRQDGGWLKKARDIFTEPMMLLLIAAGAVYLFIGDTAEALIVWLSIVPIGLMEFFQERRTSEAIAVLDKMSVKYAKVYRDGALDDLEFKGIVPGDLIYVTAGDQIAADGWLLRSFGLSVDESALTGESASVVKLEAPDEANEIKSEHTLQQGTLVVQGEGYMLAGATGANTAYGKLGGLLEKIEKPNTALQKKIHRLVRLVAGAAAVVAILVGIALGLLKGWTEGVLGGLTVAMSLIPEEFPVVFSAFLIMGMWRLARQNALAREMVMVETLGSATSICADKTGTLTEGRMSLKKIFYDGKIYNCHSESAIGRTKNPPELKGILRGVYPDLVGAQDDNLDFIDLIKTALLSLERVAVDPIEIETQRFAASLSIDAEQFFKEHDLIKDSSFDAKSKMVHHIWKDKNGDCAQYTVGAPESVLNNCKMSAADNKKISEIIEEQANQGLRVIGVAKKLCGCDDEISLGGMDFAGLLIMSDPPRAGVREAIIACQKAGIRVLMITGDNKLTAHNVAESIGLIHNEEILSGTDLEKMSPEALKEAVKRHSIFARVQPEQKYLIVKALQANGEVVAMTGDGVNDAPALRQADIGIAMGRRGTEVARAAAGLVLMDDNFASIVGAVREGRRIYDNMRQAFAFLLSFHLPIVGLAIVPVLLGQSLVFIPIHIIFLELICDPAAVLGFEREKARRTLMTDPPRPVGEPLVNPALWWRVLLQGICILAVSFGFYYYFGLRGGDIALGRTLAFSSLVVSQICLILLTREWGQIKSNRVLLFISLAIIMSLLVILSIPSIGHLFRFTAPAPVHYFLIFAVPLLVMGLASWVLKRK